MFDLTFLGLIALYLVVGAVAGMSTGFLGGGGGVVTVPILIYVFSLLGYPESASVHTAVGTSLFVIIFNAASSSLVHLRKGIIHHRILIVMVLAGVLGAVVGGTTSAMTASPLFKKLLGAFLIITALRFMQASRSGPGDKGLMGEDGAVECPANERQLSAKDVCPVRPHRLLLGIRGKFFRDRGRGNNDPPRDYPRPFYHDRGDLLFHVPHDRLHDSRCYRDDSRGNFRARSMFPIRSDT